MFYCEDCAVENNWPGSLSTSRGVCEVCHKRAECYDMPARDLPTKRAFRPPVAPAGMEGKPEPRPSRRARLRWEQVQSDLIPTRFIAWVNGNPYLLPYGSEDPFEQQVNASRALHGMPPLTSQDEWFVTEVFMRTVCGVAQLKRPEGQ